ncbi:hypothetical protein CARUB_v10006666mg [Capsella rubella]|uniref:S-protein homolog n=1 Tax=Capsella rubella TaxID=81985 RepID=R0F8D7_9BRAS|nr:hypothetical protein CARUB_v10006666mg [Capsella rubella]
MKTQLKIFAVLSIFFCYSSSSCLGFNPVGKNVVTVTNDIGPGIVLNLHCKSRDDDLGVQALQPGQQFQWKFRENLIKSTEFYCNCGWNNQLKHFTAWTSYEEEGTCLKCFWSIRADGPCLYADITRKTKCQPWKNN